MRPFCAGICLTSSTNRTSMAQGLFKVGPGARSKPTRTRQFQKCLAPHRHFPKEGRFRRQAITQLLQRGLEPGGRPHEAQGCWYQPRDANTRPSRYLRQVASTNIHQAKKHPTWSVYQRTRLAEMRPGPAAKQTRSTRRASRRNAMSYYILKPNSAKDRLLASSVLCYGGGWSEIEFLFFFSFFFLFFNPYKLITIQGYVTFYSGGSHFRTLEQQFGPVTFKNI